MSENFLKSLLESLGGMTDGEILKVALEEAYADKITPVADAMNHALPPLLDKAVTDLKPLTVASVKALADIVTNPKFMEQVHRFSALRATMRHGALQAYMILGFTREEAFKLLMADVNKARNPMAEFSKNVSAKLEKK